MSNHPAVSILLPVLNEVTALEACLDSLADQDYGGAIELIVADGGSSDGTLDLLAKRSEEPKVIQNPDRIQSHGVNRAAEVARGEILVRVDAHTTYARDYITRSVEALTTSGAVAAGGPMRPEGTTPFGRAVAAAMGSKIAIGPGRFHHSVEGAQTVDTVYLGAFRRSDFLAIGGYRSLPSGVAEDADLFYRWRSGGRTIYLDPAIRSVYRPRQHPGRLWRQFRRYGEGKADMLYVNGRWPSWRPLAPLALILGLAGSLAVAFATGLWWPILSLLALWLAALLVAARVAGGAADKLRFIMAAAIMHLSYGWGLLKSLIWRKST